MLLIRKLEIEKLLTLSITYYLVKPVLVNDLKLDVDAQTAVFASAEFFTKHRPIVI